MDGTRYMISGLLLITETFLTKRSDFKCNYLLLIQKLCASCDVCYTLYGDCYFIIKILTPVFYDHALSCVKACIQVFSLSAVTEQAIKPFSRFKCCGFIFSTKDFFTKIIMTNMSKQWF